MPSAKATTPASTGHRTTNAKSKTTTKSKATAAVVASPTVVDSDVDMEVSFPVPVKAGETPAGGNTTKRAAPSAPAPSRMKRQRTETGLSGDKEHSSPTPGSHTAKTIKDNQLPVATPPRRGRGRPRKNPLPATQLPAPTVRRGPGRPRKNPVVVPPPKSQDSEDQKDSDSEEESSPAPRRQLFTVAIRSGPKPGTRQVATPEPSDHGSNSSESEDNEEEEGVEMEDGEEEDVEVGSEEEDVEPITPPRRQGKRKAVAFSSALGSPIETNSTTFDPTIQWSEPIRPASPPSPPSPPPVGHIAKGLLPSLPVAEPSASKKASSPGSSSSTAVSSPRTTKYSYSQISGLALA
ncbi:hypothetical protein BDN72DRAFT_905578 [Pluteus cervinus]|uniref:Uncharacterized protein n=1 Tax=Pluteus cervinus TaxID=181527 RepID=A0ACD3A367_9AGAR|nr:hypothetical protein BDN72DRAFT_905578 [Pluteus cervinus]